MSPLVIRLLFIEPYFREGLVTSESEPPKSLFVQMPLAAAIFEEPRADVKLLHFFIRIRDLAESQWFFAISLVAKCLWRWQLT